MRSDSDSYTRKRLLFAPLYEMYQISVCRVKSKYASSFGFLSKTIAKIQQFFQISKSSEHYSSFFLIFLYFYERAVIGRGFPTVNFISTLAVLRMRVKHFPASLLHAVKERSIFHFVIFFALFN